MPIKALTSSQSITIGENVDDNLCVPRLCTTNTANMIMHVSGKTRTASDGTSTEIPSIDESTDTAGVRTPSPKSKSAGGILVLEELWKQANHRT